MPKRTYHQYSADTKHHILRQYKRDVRGCGFRALALKHGVPNGARTLEYWYSKWDGTPASLEKQTTSHKRRRLDPQQVQQNIRGYVETMNKQGDQVIYADVKEHVEEETAQPIAYSTLTRYGYNEAHVSYKRTTRTLTTDDSDYRDNVIEFRRKAQRVAINKLVFVDQTNTNESYRRGYGLAPKGKKAKVSTRKPSRYTPRVDVMGACVGNRVLDLDVLTPEDRRRAGVKGYTKQRVLSWFRHTLARQIRALPYDDVVVVVDKALSIKPEEVKGALQAGWCTNVAEVWVMETGIAKHCSPLDNSIWHEWKERVRAAAPVSEGSLYRIIQRQWHSLPSNHVTNYYRKCALTRHADVTRELD